MVCVFVSLRCDSLMTRMCLLYLFPQELEKGKSLANVCCITEGAIVMLIPFLPQIPSPLLRPLSESLCCSAGPNSYW